MHPLLLLLILVAAAAAMHAHPAAAGTPAGRFWEETLPSSPMPKAIADLVQQGTGHSPLVDNHTLPNSVGTEAIWTIVYNVGSFQDMAAVPQGLFFPMAQLRVGTTMTVSFPPVTLLEILPRDVAEKIPFGNLADVLSRFNIAPSSTEAAKVGDTLSRCQAPALAGEQKACTTSLEATVESAMRMLGTTSRVWAVASALPRAGLPPQPYLIQAVRLLDGDRHVGCHGMPYPYAVYNCHTTGRPTKAYVVSLRGLRKGPEVDMAAICHLNTSSWNPAYPAFKILHTKPGGAPVCHFMLYGNLVFGEKAANA